jgi:asparagine synthase (glutamine-hydrolysing)
MCGINGIITHTPITDIEKRIDAMNAAIQHRGRDSDGTMIHENVALGHRRLSIIDLKTSGKQPMTSASGQWTIVFNGEIYNFHYIKRKLSGYSFVGESDSEVILAALEYKGIEWFLEKANGMFAIAAYNHLSSQTFLIRDRLGIKPLYYSIYQDKVVFSSEIKGILASGLISAQFNELAVDDYLAYRYVRDPNTFFLNVFSVEPGHYIEFQNAQIVNQTKYWEVPTCWNQDVAFNDSEIANEFSQKLEDSVKLRLMSEVPLGCYLSGGVDSSLLTAIVQKYSRTPVHTYNIGFDNLNEFEFARIIAKQHNTNHQEMVVTSSVYFDHWDSLIHFKDAPLAVPNEIPLSLMSTRLKEDISVVLSGEGADELLGGYGKIFRSHYDFKNHNVSGSFHDYFIGQYEYVNRAFRDKYLRNPTGYRHDFDYYNQTLFDGPNGDQSIFRFFHKFHVRGLLQRVDMSTMQTTVEARVPFLDHKLIEFVYESVPAQLKLKWNNPEAKNSAKTKWAKDYSEVLDTPKYLLKKIAYQYLDKRVVDRRKVGFPVPLNDWISELTTMAMHELKYAPWLKTQLIPDLLQACKSSPRAGQIVWMFLNVEKFRKQYFEKQWTW